MNFDGIVGRTMDESRPGTAPSRVMSGPRPNVLVWIMDDIGYGQLSPYGGLIDMPNLERVARMGVTFTNAHATAICAPTRAALLTGRNHHSNNMNSVPRFSAELPGHTARIPRENGFLSEILQQEAGYATMAVGKWHLTTIPEMSLGADRKSWPLGRGFERFYGFMSGQTNPFEPHLVCDNHVIRPPARPEDGYHLDKDLIDQAIHQIHELRAADESKPFFLYLAFGTAHAPHNAPREWIDRYAGMFDDGWDAYRDTVFARQLARGIMPEYATMSERDPDVPAWSELSAAQQRVAARLMEAFAGMCAHMDHEVGRLLDELAELGELDNTVILALSDNGASAEGGPTGALNNQQWQGGLPQTEPGLDDLDIIGGPDACNHYPWGWSWAGNTPFRRWKRETYRGGVSVPFVMSWPGVARPGTISDAYVYVTDFLPTVLDGINIAAPEKVDGRRQTPVEGVSFLAVLGDPDAESRHTTQYYEMMGHRAIYSDGWRAVCPWPGEPSFAEGRDFPAELTAADLDRLEEHGWELFAVAKDPGETRNLAADEPGRLAELVQLWWSEARKYHVLPIIGRFPGGTAAGTSRTDGRTRFTYFPDNAPVWVETAVNTVNASHRITAHARIPADRTSGVILALGGRFGGYSFFMKEGRLCYVYNNLQLNIAEVVSGAAVPVGEHLLQMEFLVDGDPDTSAGRGAPGTVRLLVDGETVAEQYIDRTAPVMLTFTGTLTCGYHGSEAMARFYAAPYSFTGELKKVTVELLSEAVRDPAAEEFVAQVRQ